MSDYLTTLEHAKITFGDLQLAINWLMRSCDDLDGAVPMEYDVMQVHALLNKMQEVKHND